MILNNQIWGIQHVQTKPPIFGFHIAKGCATGISSIHCASVVGIRLATSCTSNFLFELVKPFLARSAFLFQDLYNISRRYRHVFLSFTYPHLWHFQCLKSEKVGLYMCCLTQWIGFVGKIYTGNQSYFPMKYGGFPVKMFPTKPIHRLTHSQMFRLHGFASQVLELFSQLSSLGWDLLISMTCYTRPGKRLHNYGKSPFLRCKWTKNGRKLTKLWKFCMFNS